MLKRKKPIFEGKMHIRKNDEVVVLAGKDKGRKGKVIEALPEQGTVIVDNVNMVTRHQKPRGQGRQAAVRAQTGAIEKPAPLPIGKVMLVCPKCSKPTRAAASNEGERSRMCKHCHQTIDA